MGDVRPSTLKVEQASVRIEWNGDKARGWTFYCLCGYCTPMKRSFEEASEAWDNHRCGLVNLHREGGQGRCEAHA